MVQGPLGLGLRVEGAGGGLSGAGSASQICQLALDSPPVRCPVAPDGSERRDHAVATKRVPGGWCVDMQDPDSLV